MHCAFAAGDWLKKARRCQYKPDMVAITSDSGIWISGVPVTWLIVDQAVAGLNVATQISEYKWLYAYTDAVVLDRLYRSVTIGTYKVSIGNDGKLSVAGL